MRGLTVLLLTVVFALGHAGDLAPLESQKIDYLINAIATLEHAQFVRNGTAYDAQAAADHLRLKLKNAGSRVKSAEDFIRYCASVSSKSGVPYQIRFSDGTVVTSEAFLRNKLAEFQNHKG
jgi:Family of unknown function (DUF5329)